MKDLLTAKQLAEELGMSWQVVLRWNREGRIKATIDLPGMIRFDLLAVRKQLIKATEAAAKRRFSGMVPTL